jgi:hypothetical protein
MTLKQVIDHVDSLKPNAFTYDHKTRWINEIEGQVQTEVFLFLPDNITQYTWESNQNTELFVKAPYDSIYDYYLQAQIDFHNGEYEKAQNSIAWFQDKYDAFKKWYVETYHPADRPCRGGCTCSE